MNVATDMMHEITNVIGPFLKEVDQFMRERLKTDIKLLEQVQTHVMTSNGKRVRPSLHILSSLIIDRVRPENIVVAAVSEFIHTATLLHDDVIDNSDTRRGLPTVNALWGNELSVMVGDFFYTVSNNLLLDLPTHDVLRIYSKATQEMSEGEIIQYEHRRDVTMSLEQYLDIIRRKTAVLFSACCESAAVLAKKSPEIRSTWARFGESLGMVFQLVDDLLDYAGSSRDTGKRVYTDLGESKLTMPLIHSLNNSSSRDKERIIAVLAKDEKSDEDIADISHLVSETGGLDATRELALTYHHKAIAELDVFRESPFHCYLQFLCDYVLDRSR